MRRYVIRHGETGVLRAMRGDFGIEGPPLNDTGITQARKLRTELLKKGIDLTNDSAAVSEYIRTKQTAEHAGYTKFVEYSLLNEIFTGLPPEKLKIQISKRKLPKIVLDRAKAILENPPKEKVWITHGLVIMGLKQLLGIDDEQFDPPKGLINILDI